MTAYNPPPALIDTVLADTLWAGERCFSCPLTYTSTERYDDHRRHLRHCHAEDQSEPERCPAVREWLEGDDR